MAIGRLPVGPLGGSVHKTCETNTLSEAALGERTKSAQSLLEIVPK
jgi:hypothetical protein